MSNEYTVVSQSQAEAREDIAGVVDLTFDDDAIDDVTCHAYRCSEPTAA